MERNLTATRTTLLTWRAGLVALGVAAAFTGQAYARTATAGSRGPLAAVRNAPFTLASVDRRCFYAPTPARGTWPFGAVTGIRGSFNEVRTPVHFGIDIATGVNHAAVRAIDGGVIRRIREDHFIVRDGRGHLFAYWHVRLLPSIREGARVRRGQWLGHIFWSYFHLHLSEWENGCGWVDPRRPGGVAHDPTNTEAPAIGRLFAFAANADAWALPTRGRLLNTPPSSLPRADPATSLSLAGLHGVVDLRASVLDHPVRHIPLLTQLPLAASAIRAFLAPARTESEHIGPIFLWDGGRLIYPGRNPGFRRLRHLWAFGTWRSNQCLFFPEDPSAWCGQNLVYHVGGRAGFDTRRVANGRYRYCVQALTINGVRATRCTAVRIRN